MSSFAYGLITAKRAAAPPGESQTTRAPAMTTYIDTLSALVPAEALALYVVIVAPNTTKTVFVHGKTATAISNSQLLGWSCAALLIFSTALYLIGRSTNAKSLTAWDGLRALIPPGAFAAWMLLQNPGVFDVWWPGSHTQERVVIASFAAVVLGILATALGYQVDKQSPVVPVLEGQRPGPPATPAAAASPAARSAETAAGTGTSPTANASGSVGTPAGDVSAGGAGNMPSPNADNDKAGELRPGGSNSRRPGRTLDLVKRYALTLIALVVLVVLGVLAFAVLDHQTYTKDLTARGDLFSADTVVVGLFAFLVAAVTAALAYPSYSEWRRQVRGPNLDVKVELKDVDRYIPLTNDGQITGTSIGHQLRITVANLSKVPLNDGQVNVYIVSPDGGKAQLSKEDGFKQIEEATYLRNGKGNSPPKERTVLFSRLEKFPAFSVRYLEPEVTFGSPGTFVLYAMITGSNLRSNRPWDNEWSLQVKSK